MTGRFAGWIPSRLRIDGAECRVDWCYLGSRRFVEPFFRDTIQSAMQEPFNQAFWQDTSIDALIDWARERPGLAPTAFVYHASRCGSTLIARMLMALDSHVVMSEPPPIDSVLRAHFWIPGLASAVQAQWLAALLSALGQPRAGGETRFAIKLDAWHAFDWRLVKRAYPGVPSIFLYRDPIEIAVSQLQMPGAYMVPGILGPSQLVMKIGEVMAMPRVEFIARVIGHVLEAGLNMCVEGGARAVHYSELPDAVSSSLAELLGVEPVPETLGRLRECAIPDAKNPQFTFADDRARKQRAASDDAREAIARWAMPAYRDLEALRLDGPRAFGKRGLSQCSESAALAGQAIDTQPLP